MRESGDEGLSRLAAQSPSRVDLTRAQEVADEVDGVPLMGMTVFGEQGRKAAGNRHCNLSVGVIVLE